MFTQVEVKNGLISVTQLQEKVDELIFDHIDSSKNWEKAYKGLNNLFQQTVQFYGNYVDKNSVPEGNVYWSLFLDVIGRLVYFKTLAEMNLADLQTDDVEENLIEGYIVAANCLPNINKNKDHELLDEISESFEEIRLIDGVKGKFKESIIENGNSLKDSLVILYNYTCKFAKVKQL